jgi:hypothetical protein
MKWAGVLTFLILGAAVIGLMGFTGDPGGSPNISSDPRDACDAGSAEDGMCVPLNDACAVSVLEGNLPVREVDNCIVNGEWDQRGEEMRWVHDSSSGESPQPSDEALNISWDCLKTVSEGGYGPMQIADMDSIGRVAQQGMMNTCQLLHDVDPLTGEVN